MASGVLEGQEVHLSLCVPCSYPMTLMRHCLFTCMLSPLTRKLTASYKVGGIWGGGGGTGTATNCPFSSTVTLYNCSFGRSDCSLCLAADPAYRCVWCGGQNRCVYEALCNNVTSECPPPVITRVSFVTAWHVSHPHVFISQAILLLGSANFRSSLRQARWVGAYASLSMGPIWVSQQMMSRRSLWLAKTVPSNPSGTLYLPGE